MSPPTLYSPSTTASVGEGGAATATIMPAGVVPNMRMVTDSMRVLMLIRAYQVRGHVLSDLDPLKLTHHAMPSELKLETYGFTDADLDREFFLGDTHLIGGFLSSKTQVRTLRDLLTHLREVYCGTIGVEFMHMQNRTGPGTVQLDP